MPFSGGFSFDGYDKATGAVLLKGPFGVIHKLSPNWANSVFEIKTTNLPNNNKTAASLHPSNSNNNNDNSVGINENKDDDDEEEKEEEDTYTESSCSESYVSSASTYLGENGDDDEKEEEEKEEEIKNVKLTSSIENGTSSSPQWPVHGTVLLLKSTREMRKQNGDNKHLSSIDMTSEEKKEKEKISTTQKENKEEDMAGLLYEVPLGETSQCETAVLLGYNESGNVYLLLSPNVCTGRPPTLLRLSSAAELLEYYTVRNSNSSESRSKLATETSNCLPLSEEDEEECMVRPELDVSALYDVFDVNVKNVYYLSSWSTAVQFVGVAWGIPWVTKIHKTHSAAHTNSVDSAVDVCVEPLPHCYSAHLLCELYGIREVKGQTETNSVAPSPHSHLVSVSRRLPPPPPFFVRGNKVVCRGSLGTTLECDLLPSFLSPFGVVHGERLIGVSKTAYASCKGIILGVHMGCPVLLLDGMPIATVLRGVHSAKELSELFITLRDAPENATGNCISVLPQAQNGEKGHVALSTSISEETKVNSETPVVLATGTTVRNIENKTENTVQIKETFPNSNETIRTETPREDRHESRLASGPPLKPLHNVRVELRQYLDAQVEPPPPPPPSAAAHVCADKTEEKTFIPMTREANGASSDDIHIKPYENIENKTTHTLQLECEAPDSGNCTLPNQQHAMPTSFTTPSPFFTTFLKAVAHWRMHELSEEAQRLDPLGFVRFYEVDSLHRVMGAVDILKRHGDVFSAARQSANVASLVNLLLEHEGRPPPQS